MTRVTKSVCQGVNQGVPLSRGPVIARTTAGKIADTALVNGS